MSIRICEVCGAAFDEAVAFHTPHARRIYDPSECTIHAPVPQCPNCGFEATIEPEPAAERGAGSRRDAALATR
jgi:predicted RNA-binding Zn-ribbon protein involved in translation (DUF1610 family)